MSRKLGPCQTVAQEVKLMGTLEMRDTVHRLVEMLVAGDYHGVEEASRGH